MELTISLVSPAMQQITKILAGLPMVFLRVGALGRMLFLRSFFSAKRLTQRELNEVYRPEPVQYGWEVSYGILFTLSWRAFTCFVDVAHILIRGLIVDAVPDATVGDCYLFHLCVHLSRHSSSL